MKAGPRLLLAALAALACEPPAEDHARPGPLEPAPTPSTLPVTSGFATPVTSSDASADANVPDAATPASSAANCPRDMVLIEGDFCPAALQRCTKHHDEWEKRKGDPTVSERCLEFAKPSKCLSPKRKRMRFCIDVHEWPNRSGELPSVLVQWVEAKKQCQGIGKRLCDEEEWLFACEGEEMLPHVYGYARDPTKCQIDRAYIKRDRFLKRYDGCMADPECKATFDKIDQRKPAGSFPDCISPFGVFDLNGSVNEWVNLPGSEKPNRSGLKGGWWGPVRSRCRPTVKFHKEEDWGYEAGFRCCKDADEQSTASAQRADAAASSSAMPVSPPAEPARKPREHRRASPSDVSRRVPEASAPSDAALPATNRDATSADGQS